MIDIDAQTTLGSFTLDVAFRTPARGVTALFGRSGSGKTSVLRLVAGALTPTTGRIAVGEHVFFDRATGIDVPVERRRIGYVFQDARLFPHLSVRGNLTFGARRTRMTPPLSFDDTVDLLGIAGLLDRRVHALSGGERQRVALGRALLAAPDLLLMDEPLAALDPPRKSELLSYIESLRDDVGVPILYVSHDFDEVVRLADHLIAMDQGRVVKAGTLLDLAADPDLAPLIGRFESGAVLACTIAAHAPSVAMTLIRFAGGELRVPRVDLPVGTAVRVRIRARDVALALTDPADVSITNRLPGTITRLAVQPDGPYADVVVDVGGAPVRATITRESVERLQLTPGKAVWVLIKSVAFDSRSVGFRRQSRHAPRSVTQPAIKP